MAYNSQVRRTVELAYKGLLETGPQTVSGLTTHLGWGKNRTDRALRILVSEGRATKSPATPSNYTAVQPPEIEVTLKGEQVYVVFAALLAMVREVHSVQDNLDEAQWGIAEKLDQQFEGLANLYRQRA
jgi:hypothetical protein